MGETLKYGRRNELDHITACATEDPPYLGHENEYRYRIDYPAMVELLNSAKAKVVVSEYPDAAEFYRGWNRIDRVTASRAGTGRHNYRGKKKTEVLFTNF